jgi:hypothetical protein
MSFFDANTKVRTCVQTASKNKFWGCLHQLFAQSGGQGSVVEESSHADRRCCRQREHLWVWCRSSRVNVSRMNGCCETKKMSSLPSCWWEICTCSLCDSSHEPCHSVAAICLSFNAIRVRIVKRVSTQRQAPFSPQRVQTVIIVIHCGSGWLSRVGEGDCQLGALADSSDSMSASGTNCQSPMLRDGKI